MVTPVNWNLVGGISRSMYRETYAVSGDMKPEGRHRPLSRMVPGLQRRHSQSAAQRNAGGRVRVVQSAPTAERKMGRKANIHRGYGHSHLLPLR